ncbi:MAG: ketopantoate reductase family protein [Bryobacteraceae bacterium]
MKSAIVGAGAVGAYMGALMARAGQDVTLFARGPHLRAMRERGVRVIAGDGEFEAHPKVSGSLAEIGPCDVVFLAVKAHGLTSLAPLLSPLIGPETVVVSMQNGVPWWYFEPPLERVDPGGIIAAAIDPRRVAGSIVYFATEVVSPGVVRHVEGNRISLGEPDGSRSERCRPIAEALIAAGLRCPITTRIRQEIWVKILGNAAFNPISALTGATLAGIARDPEACGLVRQIMEEAVAIAAKLGMEMPVSIERRIAGAANVGEHKTSMLQDLEAGRPMELEAVAGAVVELGDRLGVPVPHLRSVYACAKLLGSVRAGS